MLKLRDYQITLSDKGLEILKKYHFLILSMEVRCGKTFTALETIKKFGAKKVLFLTKKKAISSIESDGKYYAQNFELIVINYESLHKIEGIFDIIVLDESHCISAFPKPGLKYKNIKKRFGDLPMILLSGTITTESFSQYFHQIHVSNNTVWKCYKNFYKWANDFVKIKQQKTSYGWCNDYSRADYDKIMRDISHYILTFTQKEAQFTTSIKEHILHVKMKDSTYSLMRQLEKDKVIEGKDDVIIADTMVSLQQKLHQIASGTCKLDSGKAITLDKSKGEFIKQYFKGKRIAIFYLFKQEQILLKEIFGDTITDDLDEFNNTDKHFFTQVVKGREGISLAKADCLVFYNIAFSALSYHQAKDRLTTKDRLENHVYWVFAEDGIEDYIYKSVQKKKNFTSKVFEKSGFLT